jgi:integrase
MPGCRPLTDAEVQMVFGKLPDARLRCLFIMGIRTGLRISQLLDLDVTDVLGQDVIQTHRKPTNKSSVARDIPVHQEVKNAIQGYLGSSGYTRGRLFGCLTDKQARTMLKEAFTRCDLNGKLSTHTMRKTFAMRMYLKLGKDLVATQRALGHVDVNSTAKYISVNMDAVNKAILED